MKKLTLILGASLLLASCSKEELSKTYCAYCTEITTGTQALPFCGSTIIVNSYISDKESFDPASPDQVWSCYKEEQL